MAQWQGLGHVFAFSASETGEDQGDDRGGELTLLASVPQWLTVLLLISGTDGIATVPRRLAERHADRLGLQVVDLPVPSNCIQVSVMRRSGAPDPAAEWLLDQVRWAIGS
jgi:DNA-binding transcriptional LysR family regulator